MCGSIVVDPVNRGHIVTGCGNIDGRVIYWYVSNDYGNAWTLVNSTTVSGYPTTTGDPNPDRDPCTPQTLWTTGLYGSDGAWVSYDGAYTWTRNAAADVAFAPYEPYGVDDPYEIVMLPDSVNHLLATWHYGFYTTGQAGGIGESTNGGASWTIHLPPTNFGSSHYVIPFSGTTWGLVAEQSGGVDGLWQTTTAGRTGGTAANGYQDGTVSTTAWTQVATIEHPHGAFQPAQSGSTWYVAGVTASESSIWSSSDQGATWQDLQAGYYWWSANNGEPIGPNPTFVNKNACSVAVTNEYIYSNYFMGPDVAVAPIASPTSWWITAGAAASAGSSYFGTTASGYFNVPSGLNGTGGDNIGTASTLHPSGRWMILLATTNQVWRYIEP